MTAIRSFALALLLASAAAAARAEIVVYTDRDEFMWATTLQVNTFNHISYVPYPTPTVTTAGDYLFVIDVNPSGMIDPVGPLYDLRVAPLNSGDTLTITPVTPGLNAIGGLFFGTGADGQFAPGADIVLVANFRSGQETHTLHDATTTSFIGFASPGDVLLSLTVGTVGGPLRPTINDLLLGIRPIPEPATSSMLLAGILTLGWLSRRRR